MAIIIHHDNNMKSDIDSPNCWQIEVLSVKVKIKYVSMIHLVYCVILLFCMLF